MIAYWWKSARRWGVLNDGRADEPAVYANGENRQIIEDRRDKCNERWAQACCTTIRGGQQVPTAFRGVFDRLDDPKNERAKFLSRLFGIFSERVVSIWANDERAPYENLGRPTLRTSDDVANVQGYTLDFTFRDRSTGKVYASEMKCEIEYLNFKYFILEASHQLDHHKKPAFHAFLAAAHSPDQLIVHVQQKPISINGAILVWGAINSDTKKQIMSERGFHDILSVENICRDLVQWKNPEYRRMIGQYRSWSNRLFDGLLSV